MAEFAFEEKKKENRTGIPAQLKERMEQSTGLSFDDVQVRYNSDKPAKLGSLAYTQGNQIEVAPGQERHLPHELGHVVQQKLGLVQANEMHPSGVAMNTDAALERQADEIGAGRSVNIVQRQVPGGLENNAANRAGIVQRYIEQDGYILAQASSESQSRMVMVKKNEPATIYFHESITERMASFPYLMSLGIQPAKTAAGSIPQGFTRFEQGQIPNIAKLDNENRNIPQPKRDDTDLKEAESRLYQQSMVLHNFLVLARELRKNMETGEVVPTPRNILTYYDHFISTFTSDPMISTIYSALGNDIFLDFYALRNIAQNLHVNKDKEIALDIIIEDLTYRRSQVDSEAKMLPYIPLLPTGCNTSADSRGKLIPEYQWCKADFGIPESPKTDQKIPFINVMSWAYHYATPIPLPGEIIGEDDKLYIEDAVGKSSGGGEGANAHWTAHIYGRAESDSESSDVKQEQEEHQQNDYNNLICKFNNLSPGLRNAFFEKKGIKEGDSFKMTYICTRKGEKGSKTYGNMEIVVRGGLLKYKLSPAGEATEFKPDMEHFLTELAEILSNDFILQAFTLDDQEELENIRDHIGELSNKAVGTGFLDGYFPIEKIPAKIPAMT